MELAPALSRAFAERADGARIGAAPRVGVFGEGAPLALIAAAGGRALDVKAPPLADARNGPVVASVAAVVEDFMDAFATRFLHRFAAGAFDDFALIVFARDDVAGLAAYQYAQELRRQGRVSAAGPRLHLWNLLHTDSRPAERFNLRELARLEEVLAATLGLRPDGARLEAAVAAETRRAQAAAGLPAGGAAAFIARNAGRWLDADDHAALLEAMPAAPGVAPTVVLAGTPCDIPVLHEICDGFGRVAADLQDYGRAAVAATGIDRATMLRGLAGDPLHLRAAPPGRLTAALAENVAGADLVICSVDPNDDAFGWEIPGLRRAVEAGGGRFVDLGFRPFRPDAGWIDTARTRIAEALA